MRMISVVVPLYHEAEGLARLHAELDSAAARVPAAWEFVLVDDGSQDDTWPRLSELAARDPRVRAIRLKRNFGQTAAMACGIRHAKGAVIVTMDGDLQNDPADIPLLLAKLDQDYDVVCGWRHRRQDKLVTRKIPSMVANRLIGWVTGVPLHDYGCSLKAYRAQAIKRTPLYAEFHRFIPALSTLTGALVAEVKVNHRPRTFGRTKYNLSRTWRVALDMVTVSLLVKFAAKPIRYFGTGAVVCAAIGLWCVARAWGAYVGPTQAMLQVVPGIAVLSFWLSGHLMVVGWLAELCLITAHGRPERLVAPAD